MNTCARHPATRHPLLLRSWLKLQAHAGITPFPQSSVHTHTMQVLQSTLSTLAKLRKGGNSLSKMPMMQKDENRFIFSFGRNLFFSQSKCVCDYVYYESIKRELKIRGIYECRCDERLQTKTKRFTLPYTGLVSFPMRRYYENHNIMSQ